MCGDRAQGFYSARMKTAHDMAQHSGPRPRVPPHHGRELHGATSRFAYDRPQSSNNQIGNQPQLLLAKASHLYPAGKDERPLEVHLRHSEAVESRSVGRSPDSLPHLNSGIWPRCAGLRPPTTVCSAGWLVECLVPPSHHPPHLKICIVSATVDGHSGRRRTWQNYKRR